MTGGEHPSALAPASDGEAPVTEPRETADPKTETPAPSGQSAEAAAAEPKHATEATEATEQNFAGADSPQRDDAVSVEARDGAGFAPPPAGPDDDRGEKDAPLDETPDLPDRAPMDGVAGRYLMWTRVLVGVVGLGAIAAAILGLRLLGAHTETSDREEALDVARTVSGQMVTLGATDAPQHVDVMLGLSTDPFRQQLTGMSAAFQEVLKEGRVATQGTVDSAGIETIGNGQAHVMVTAHTIIRNTQIPNGTPRDYRLQIGLREVDGAWRVSSVDVAK